MSRSIFDSGGLSLSPFSHPEVLGTAIKLSYRYLVVTALRWVRKPVRGTMLTDPGVYCLRSNELSWDTEQLWRTLHVRKTTRPEPDLLRLYDALGLAHQPGGVQKLMS